MTLAGRLSRRAAFVAFAYTLIVTLAATTLATPLYGIYQREWGFSPSMLTVIFAAYMIGVVVALLFFGRLSDQIGRRAVVLPAVILAVVATTMAALAPNMIWLIAARFIVGLSSGLLNATTTAALTEMHGANDPRKAALVASASTIAGLGWGPLMAGLIAQFLPWPTVSPYLIELGLLAPALIGIALAPETLAARASKITFHPRVGVPREILFPFLLAGGSIFAGFTVLSYFTSLAPSLIAQELKLGQVWFGGFIVTVMFAASSIAQLALRQIRSEPAMRLGLAALSLGMAAILLSGPVDSVLLLVAGTLLGGLGQGLSFMGSLGLVNHLAPPERRGEVVASYFVAGYLGGTFPVLIVGQFVGLIGLFWATAGMTAGVALLALAITLGLGRMRRR
jgi:MFS family permease